MAKRKVQLDQEAFLCSICLDLLNDPVTIPCGHNYCMICIQTDWGEENERRICKCPQCRKTFRRRPVLVKNTMLAELVEELKKTEPHGVPDDQCYAGPEDVACDVCTARKQKAKKSCLVCLVSYCKKHLQPHCDVPQLKKHKLVEPSKNLQENICSHHDEVMKMFCRTDQQAICYLCSVDEHKGHDTVSAAAERAERQGEVQGSLQQILQRVQDSEEEVKECQRQVEAISLSADKTVEHSEKIFTELNHVIQKRRSDVEQQVRSQQETEVRRVKERQEKLEQEITELKRKAAELEQLTHTEDHIHFLHNYRSLSELNDSSHSSRINSRPLSSFDDMTAAVSELRVKLQDTLRHTETRSEPEPETRDEFLKYSCQLTLDPNTADPSLLLSEGNTKVTLMEEDQRYPSHRDRFNGSYQVLSRQKLTGRCYWEVVWSGCGIDVAVSYKNIRRLGCAPECVFGGNSKSWALDCYEDMFKFWFDMNDIKVSGPPSYRIGVYLDHGAGILSFYSVTENMNLLHRVQTTFTRPLYAGLTLGHGFGDTAQFCKPK